MRIKNKFKRAYHVLKTKGFKRFFKQSFRFFVKKTTLGRVNIYAEIDKKPKEVSRVLFEAFPNVHVIKTLKVQRDEPRLNIVLEALEKSSFFGGVATSLILATLFANKYEIPLRIITRSSPPIPRVYNSFLKLMDIPKPLKVEYFSDYDRGYDINFQRLEVSENDIFLSTSWSTSQVVKSINLRNTSFYILQEVESILYPNGDNQYMCESILQDPSIKYLLNSKMLADYYQKESFENVVKNSLIFEPAFPNHLYYPKTDAFHAKSKKKLFFYARPSHPQNLFYTGLKILDTALLHGVINKDEWEIYFAGNDVPKIAFSNGFEPKLLGQLDWAGYMEFIKSVDLAFSLMYTPHPSYIPLDVAASGGVVLTNKYDTKQSVSYSDNILCENLDLSSMMQGFTQAIELANDGPKRQKNYLNNKIEKSWENTFEETLNYMYAHK